MVKARTTRPQLGFILLGLALILSLPCVNCTLSTEQPTIEKRVLNEFITYYEPIIFAVNEDSNDDHKIPIESTPQSITSVPLLIDVNAFGNTYKLELKQSSRMLSTTANISILGGVHQCEAHRLSTFDIGQHLVEGIVIGDSSSYVHGIFREGVFTGIIRSDNQTIFVEKASKYFSEKVSFDCVVFRLEDLNTTAFDCTMGPDGFKCDPVKLLQRTGPVSGDVLPLVDSSGLPSPRTEWRNFWARKTPPKNTCRLKLVADHLFYENAGEQAIDNAIYEMIFHVNEADRIFRATDFDGDGIADGIGFQVHAIEVHTNTQCEENPTLSKSALSSDQYLELFSEKDFHNYCVGVAFSGHTFPGRVLGIAWMADANSGGYVGGICEPRLYSTQDQKALSFNTAVITMMLEGRKVPRGISAIAVAHELGHSFGSDHDPYQDPVCSPGREAGGKYIMAAYAVKGDQPNNRLFSQCSKKSMRSVLRKKSTCFTGASTVCAGMVEENEACNCANVESSPWMELCCNPEGEHGIDPNCVLRREIGSPSAPYTEVCCNDECTIVSAEDYKECETETHDDDCLLPVTETEHEDECLSSRQKPDGTTCHMGHGICIAGRCIIDPCIERGMENCECPNEADACIVCCRTHNEADCIPARRDEVPWLMLRRPGEPCRNGFGVCNSHGQCDQTIPQQRGDGNPGSIGGGGVSPEPKEWNFWSPKQEETNPPKIGEGNNQESDHKGDVNNQQPDNTGGGTNQETDEKSGENNQEPDQKAGENDQKTDQKDGKEETPSQDNGTQTPPTTDIIQISQWRGRKPIMSEIGPEIANEPKTEEQEKKSETPNEGVKQGVVLTLLPEGGDTPSSEKMVVEHEGLSVKDAFVKLVWVIIGILAILIGGLLFIFCCPLTSISRWFFKQYLGERANCDNPAAGEPEDQNQMVGSSFFRPMRHAASLDLSHPRYRSDPPSATRTESQTRSRSY